MKQDVVAMARAAGVVGGAGGAGGFPTHVKLNARVDTVIVNGAECEPLWQWISFAGNECFPPHGHVRAG